jgi:endonuclease-3
MPDMRTSEDGFDPSSKIQAIADRLDACYQPRRWKSTGSPIDEIVATILSQHTSDVNSSRAFAELKRRYPSWREVIEAPVSDVAAAIQSGDSRTSRRRAFKQP